MKLKDNSEEKQVTRRTRERRKTSEMCTKGSIYHSQKVREWAQEFRISDRLGGDQR